MCTVAQFAVFAAPPAAEFDVARAGVRIGTGIRTCAMLGAGDTWTIVDVRFAVSASPPSNATAGVRVGTGIRTCAMVGAGDT